MQLKTKRLIAREWLILWCMIAVGCLVTVLLRLMRFWFGFGQMIWIMIVLYVSFSFLRSFVWAMRTIRRKD